MERPGEVDRDDLVPIRGRGVRDLDHPDDAGRVDPEPQGARLGRRPLGEREHRGAIGDVDPDRDEPCPRRERRDVGPEHRQAVGEEGGAERPAEIARGTGDHGRRHQLAASRAARSRSTLLSSLPLALRGRGVAQSVMTSGTL